MQSTQDDHQDEVLLDILSLVKNNQVSVIDFADISSKVNRLIDEFREAKSENKKIKEIVYSTNVKIDNLIQSVNTIIDDQSSMCDRIDCVEEDSRKYVTVDYCTNYHKDIKTKVWTISYPIIIAIIFYAIYSIFGITLK